MMQWIIALVAGFALSLLQESAPDSQPTTAEAPATAEAPTTEPAEEVSVRTLADADELLLRGDYENALKGYEKFAASDERRVPATIGLTRVKVRIGEYDDAISALEHIEPLLPKAPQGADARRVAAWHTVLAEALEAKGRYDDAMAHLREAIELDRGAYAARTRLGRLLELLGRRDEAVETCRFYDDLLTQKFPDTAEQVTAAAVGFYRYSALTRHPNLNDRTEYVLHELLQRAYEQMDRGCWPARIAAAELLASKYNLSEEDGAVADYNAALRINPNLPEAHVGLGRIALEGWQFEEVEKHIEAALKINPSCVPALALRASLKIQERRYSEAIEAAERALAVNPNDLRSLGLIVSAYLCRPNDVAPDDGDASSAGPDEYRQRAESLNPCSAVYYAALGDTLGGLRQYQRSEEAYHKAIECEPTDPNPRCELGMMLMQWGEEGKARDALEAAWALDPYNHRTKNTLDLLDTLEGFATHETPHFIIRYDKAADSILAQYFADYLEQIYEDVTGDYETELTEKTTIEIFPTHRQFGVRITGKPWIHTVGACTGKVIAMDSPRRHPQLQGPYNFARVLRHEFTHTVTLAATQNRIAHWFTEGLAVLQEDSPRSFDWTELLADTVRRERLFTLQSIDWGFMRPQRPTDRTLAYAQSEWMCEYIVERFGYDVINKMLAAFDEGRSQRRVFLEVLGVAPESFDADFKTWAAAQVKEWGFPLDPPESVADLRTKAEADDADAGILARLAAAELDDGEADRALESARKALAADAEHPLALTVMIRLLERVLRDPELSDARRTEVADEVVPLCERLMEVDPKSWVAPRVRGQIALKRRDFAAAEECFKTLKRLCPMDPVSYHGLAAIHLDRGDGKAALPELLQIAKTEEHDADIPLNIARIYDKDGRLPDARFWYRQAIYIDPFAHEPHEGLAAASMKAGDTAAALAEYKTLCVLDPENSGRFADAAFAFHKAGDVQNARTYAEQAVKLDAESPARSLLAVP